MTDKILKPALAVLENGPTNNELQTPSSMTAVTDQDNLEEGEITEEDGSSTASTPPRIAGQLLKTSSGTSLSSKSAQSSRLSSPSITACGSTATPTTPQHSDAGPNMTREDLDHTKNLVLDLLGWGVSPEYLVEAGVSAGVLYRVFSDLNLRLPTNLVLPPTQPLPPSGIR